MVGTELSNTLCKIVPVLLSEILRMWCVNVRATGICKRLSLWFWRSIGCHSKPEFWQQNRLTYKNINNNSNSTLTYHVCIHYTTLIINTCAAKYTHLGARGQVHMLPLKFWQDGQSRGQKLTALVLVMLTQEAAN